jgi:electron transfer flavoprotein alpha subunit
MGILFILLLYLYTEDLQSCEKRHLVYHGEGKSLTSFQGLPENFAPLLVENIKKGGFTHILAGNSAFGKNVMPRVAALLDTQQISDITAIESEDSMLCLR